MFCKRLVGEEEQFSQNFSLKINGIKKEERDFLLDGRSSVATPSPSNLSAGVGFVVHYLSQTWVSRLRFIITIKRRRFPCTFHETKINFENLI